MYFNTVQSSTPSLSKIYLRDIVNNKNGCDMKRRQL